MYCRNAYIKDRKILCKESGISCAHVHFCGITMKWSQTESARKCPGNPEREDDNGTSRKAAEEHPGEV